MLRLFVLFVFLVPGATHAQGVALLDRIVAVVNKEVVTLSELSEVLGRTRSEHQHQLRICIAQLRRKLEVDPAQPMSATA